MALFISHIRLIQTNFTYVKDKIYIVRFLAIISAKGRFGDEGIVSWGDVLYTLPERIPIFIARLLPNAQGGPTPIPFESASPGANPGCAASVDEQISSHIVTQAVGIVRIVAVNFYAGTVIVVQGFVIDSQR